jgi:predicted Zn-dependent protease
MGPAEATALRAVFQSAMDEAPTSVRALAEAAVKADAREALAYEALGLIADKEGRKEDAQASLGQAMDLGSQSFYAHYRLAQLLWKTDNDTATLTRMAAALEKAISLNPDHPWSQSLLADVRVSLGDATAALGPARQAVALSPGEPYHRRVLARVLGTLDDFEAAQAEAGRALALAKTEDEKRNGREMLAWLSRKRLATTPPSP